ADLSMSRGPADLWGGFETNGRFNASCRSACRVSRPCRVRILLRPLKVWSLSSHFLQSVFQNSFANKEMRTLSRTTGCEPSLSNLKLAHQDVPDLSFVGVCEPAGDFPLFLPLSTVNLFSEP